jgi:hypothetical protein
MGSVNRLLNSASEQKKIVTSPPPPPLSCPLSSLLLPPLPSPFIYSGNSNLTLRRSLVPPSFPSRSDILFLNLRNSFMSGFVLPALTGKTKVLVFTGRYRVSRATEWQTVSRPPPMVETSNRPFSASQRSSALSAVSASCQIISRISAGSCSRRDSGFFQVSASCPPRILGCVFFPLRALLMGRCSVLPSGLSVSSRSLLRDCGGVGGGVGREVEEVLVVEVGPVIVD